MIEPCYFLINCGGCNYNYHSDYIVSFSVYSRREQIRPPRETSSVREAQLPSPRPLVVEMGLLFTFAAQPRRTRRISDETFAVDSAFAPLGASRHRRVARCRCPICCRGRGTECHYLGRAVRRGLRQRTRC